MIVKNRQSQSAESNGNGAVTIIPTTVVPSTAATVVGKNSSSATPIYDVESSQRVALLCNQSEDVKNVRGNVRFFNFLCDFMNYLFLYMLCSHL